MRDLSDTQSTRSQAKLFCNVMSWFSASVAFADLDGDKSAEMLQGFAADMTPHAVKRVCKRELDGKQLTSDGVIGMAAHVTLLYHGYTEDGEAMASVGDQLDLSNLSFDAQVASLYEVRMPDKGVFVLCIDLKSEPFQDLYLALRTEVERATGHKSKQFPHLDKDGKHAFKHDFHPHLTLAQWKTGEDMDRDIAGVMAKQDLFVGLKATIGGIQLHRE